MRIFLMGYDYFIIQVNSFIYCKLMSKENHMKLKPSLKPIEINQGPIKRMYKPM